MKNRLQWYYEDILRDKLLLKTIPSNSFELPSLKRVHLNLTSKEVIKTKKVIHKLYILLELLSSQKPIFIKARKSISQWKLRKNSLIGVKVNLRQNRMFEFIDKLIHNALCKDRDFKGITLSTNYHSYSLGISDSFLFPEIESQYDKFQTSYGFHINFEIRCKSIHELQVLLSGFHFPIIKA